MGLAWGSDCNPCSVPSWLGTGNHLLSLGGQFAHASEGLSWYGSLQLLMATNLGRQVPQSTGHPAR